MPRTVTTLLSSKFLASLPSTTSLLLSHDLHDPLLHVELLLLSLEPLLLSPGTRSFSCPTASNNFSHLSMAALNLASNHTSMVLSWLFFHNSSLLSPLLSTHSSTSAPKHFFTLRHPTGKRGRPTTLLSLLGWPLPHIQQGKAEIYLYGYIHSIAI